MWFGSNTESAGIGWNRVIRKSLGVMSVARLPYFISHHRIWSLILTVRELRSRILKALVREKKKIGVEKYFIEQPKQAFVE